MLQKFTILFDLDGTLVDTAPDLMNAHNHVMKKFGYKTKSTEDIRKLVGKGSASFIGRSVWGQSKLEFGNNPKKALFGIIQGGIYKELRLESLDKLMEINFDGYAMGGLAVGETQEQMFKVLEKIAPSIPKNKPRYLMGVGMPSDILGAVKRGIDMFDCVIPTRSGRTGLAFTWKGRINLRNSKYKRDESPIDDSFHFKSLNKYSKSYINHLINSNEILASMILTMNNICFYQQLMQKIRESIKNNTFEDFYSKYINII